MSTPVLRPPAEERFADELAALASADRGDRPPGWSLSPRAVRTFVLGDSDRISRKFHGDDALVERAIVGLASNRALLLVGEPGTAKSWLSELLSAAISGTSRLLVQGTAGTTEDQVRYGWNYALLLAEGPSPRALVPSPLLTAMKAGRLARFEEITRCPPEVQDGLVSLLSEKAMAVPELGGPDGLVFARPGFNVIATANVRDRGVHEMSAALKRRFNFETLHPITDLAAEVDLVQREATRLLAEAGAPATLGRDAVEVLVSAFQDLRRGVTPEGIKVERPAAVMSTAEAVSVAMAAGLDAWYFGDRSLGPREIARHLAGALVKDESGDIAKLKHWFGAVVPHRAERSKGLWAELLRHKRDLGA